MCKSQVNTKKSVWTSSEEVVLTWWSLNESKATLKGSGDSFNLATVVAVQRHVIPNVNIIIVWLRKTKFTFIQRHIINDPQKRISAL